MELTRKDYMIYTLAFLLLITLVEVGMYHNDVVVARERLYDCEEEITKSIEYNITFEEDYPNSYYEAKGWTKVYCDIEKKMVWDDGCNHHDCFRGECLSTMVGCLDEPIEWINFTT